MAKNLDESMLDGLLAECKTPGYVEALYSQLLQRVINGSIWDNHTSEFSDGFPANFLSLPARKSAMLAPWLAHVSQRSIWDIHTPEFSDSFPADFLSLPACKSAMLVPWLAHALKSSRRKVLRDAITASSGVSAAHFYAETTS